MNSVRTVSETKRAFYSTHTRPVNSIYRRVVDELMVEMHLLVVNTDFKYDPIYALGVLTSYSRFMQGYRPEDDIKSIFDAMCSSVLGDAAQYRQDAAQMLASIEGFTWDGITELVNGTGPLGTALSQINSNPKFKYSRLFAIGLYSLLEALDPEAIKDKDKISAALKTIAASLPITEDKLQKDLELYSGNLDKMAQAQVAMADMLAADRKRRAQRDQEKIDRAAAETAAPSATTEAPASDDITPVA